MAHIHIRRKTAHFSITLIIYGTSTVKAPAKGYVMLTERKLGLEYRYIYMREWLWLPFFQLTELMYFSKIVRSIVVLALKYK